MTKPSSNFEPLLPDLNGSGDWTHPGYRFALGHLIDKFGDTFRLSERFSMMYAGCELATVEFPIRHSIFDTEQTQALVYALMAQQEWKDCVICKVFSTYTNVIVTFIRTTQSASRTTLYHFTLNALNAEKDYV